VKSHRETELRSIALHRAVADRLDPTLVGAAQARVARWLEDGSVARRWAEGWRDLLAGSQELLRRRLVEDSELMRDLRQCSPFAGALSPRERWQVLAQANGDEAR
jgi:hypothetical protein